MALILSIETATSACSVALHQTGKPIIHTSFLTKCSHAEWLMVIIENLLRVSQYDCKALAAIAVSHGPGSYTGLRIGTSVAKGLCYGLDIPLIAVSTLEALAYGISPFVGADTLLCPTIDAGRHAIYTLITDREGSIKREVHVGILDNETYRNSFPFQSLLFFGDGVPKCKSFLAEHNNMEFVENIVPSAVQIGFLAFSKFQKQLWENLATYESYYLSQFEKN